MPKLSDRARKFPDSPGIYVFSGRGNKILYVGRSVSLKKRILSYFKKDLDLRLKEMVSKAKDVNFKKTDTLLEAIVLEANFIKKYWPKYNIKDRDNRSFVYIAISREEYPKVFIARQREIEKFPKKAEYFGPYQSIALLTLALRIIRRIFPWSNCSPDSGKPCFNHQIGLCPGLCIGAISKQDYLKNIKNLKMFLSGKKKNLLKVLKKENPEAIKALKHIQDVSLMKNEELFREEDAIRIEAYDISHLTGKETYGAMVVFENGKANKEQYRLFSIKKAPANDDLRALEEVIERRIKHKEWKYPDFILIDGGKPQVDFISQVLRKLHFSVPIAGISKYGSDKLVFPKGAKSAVKNLAKDIKPILLSARNEAHRFSLKSSRRKRSARG